MATLQMPPSATPPAKKGGTKAGLLPDGPTRDVTAEGPGQNHLLCAEPDAPPPVRGGYSVGLLDTSSSLYDWLDRTGQGTGC